MARDNAVVRVCDPHAEAKAIIEVFQRSGFDMNELSIAGRDYHAEERVLGHHNAGDGMKMWRELGHFWGGLSGVLMGSAFYFIPAIGHLIVFGPLVRCIVRALEGAGVAGELSALGAGLHSLGIPTNSIVECETALKFDKFIVIAHGTSDEVAHAKGILEPCREPMVTVPTGKVRQLV